MALLDRLTSLFNRQAKQTLSLLYPYGSAPAFADDSYENYIQQGYNYNAALYSIVKVITSNFSRVKWAAYDPDTLDELPDHELTKLLKRPNPLQGQGEFFEMLLGYKLLTGNTYLTAIAPDMGMNKGVPKMLQLLPAQHIDIVPDKFGGIQKYIVDVGADMEFPAESVLHLKYANYDYDVDYRHLYGLSPIKAAARIMQVNNDGNTAMASAFQNSGAVGFFSGMTDLESLTEEQRQQLEERYRIKYQGPDKNGIPMFFNEDVKWTKLSVDPVDLAIIESQKWTLNQLCNVYQLPPVLLNPEQSTYNNMSEAREALWEENLLPELKRTKDEMNRFFNRFFPDVIVDYDTSEIGVLQQNYADMVEWLSRADWLTPNEKREMMGYPKGSQELDTVFIPANLLPSGEIQAEKSYKATYNDYPQAASNNAKRALKYKEENGSTCGTAVGWTRANQLASRESISVDTIKRTFSFLSRAETYYTEGGSLDECGNIMYLAWGGKAMKAWCESKLNELND